MKKEEQLDYVRKLILSLLISSQQGLPLAVLEQEYYQEEKERIPWRKFGYENLVAFFNSAPQQFQVYDINNITYVRGIASEKSMHIQSLVSRQKNNSRPRYSTHTRYRTYNSTHNMQPLMRPIRISASMLIALLQHIEKYPSGISVRNAMRFIETQCPNIKLTVYDLRAQLREVSHRVYMDNNMIYPKLNDVSQKNTEHSRPRSQANSRNSNESHETEYVAAGISDEEDFVDNDALDDYVNDNRPRRPSEEFATDLPQNTSRTQYETMNDYDNADTNELGATHNGRTRDIPYSSRVSELISDKIKSRLRELVQKNPSGILCAELPEKYLNEFNVHLNYTELGFSSVREFVLYLPQIFYLKQQDGDGDYLLLSADKRPTVPDLEPPSNEHVEKRRNSRRRSEEDYNKTEDPPVPTDIPTNIANRAFVPDNAMNYYETVKLIPVTELKKETFLEVYVSEVFNPSFFWIHLRKYKEQLLQLMDDINEFYNKNYMNYIVPNVGLIKGLHCACIYDDKWHRAVIKSVKPDFQVTILFIDYGTVKTYPSDNICYLDKKFAHPPAQAIPCGLSNIRPHTGDRWTSTVNRYFCDKVLEALLAATICSIDAAHNSMMIILTDTSEEEQVHINDWLVNEKLARRAKTDTVDVANLVKYSLNKQNRLPIYCFAEDNLLPERRSQSTSTEDLEQTYPVPSEQILCDGPKRVIRPPPGFKPLQETDLSAADSSYNDAFENSVNSCTKTSPITDSKSEDLSFIMVLGNENIMLCNKIFNALPNIVKEAADNEAVLKNHITIQKELNIIFCNFVKALKLDDDKPVVDMSNLVNGAMSSRNGVDSTPKNPINSTNNVLNQKTFETTINASSNPFISSNSGGSTYDSNLLKTNELSPPVQRPLSPFSSIFKNFVSPDNSSPPGANQKTENVPLTIPNASSNFKSSSTSYCNANKSSSLFPKETNPFRMFMIDEVKMQETQNEVTNTYTDSRWSSDSAALYYNTAGNSQNHSSGIKNTNIQAMNNDFASTEHFYVNNHEKYSPKVVYESGPVMYNNWTKQDNNSKQSNHTLHNTQSASFNICDKNGPLGAPTSNSHERYINRPPINYAISSMMNNEPMYHPHNIKTNEPQPASAQGRTHMEHTEQFMNWNVFSQNHTGNFIPNTRQEGITNVPQYQTNLTYNIKEFAPRNFHQMPDPNFVNQINYLRKQLSDICTDSYNSFQNFGEKQNVTCNTLFSHSFFFKQIDPTKGASFIFHVDGNGWILVHEFMHSFTDLKSYSSLVTAIEAKNVKEACQFRDVHRSEYPVEFSQLDRCSLNLPRDSEKRITSILLISLHTALLLLYKLNKILPEEIDNIYKMTHFENDSLLNKVLALMIDYMNFKQQIEKHLMSTRNKILL